MLEEILSIILGVAIFLVFKLKLSKDKFLWRDYIFELIGIIVFILIIKWIISFF
ncbi:hypothetical protein GCM10008018_43950 [Paenibacillus marchantiophytorum]|uniref:Uncharacterized protein n=1 Tax=Paenibacillus marchantiophytorum TaxID=1619310 RepID=A0ABQ1EYE2_9BACL|nr:hypothetical protein GCM10008018_43950 [Paenibacillus marchantiophytorum]